MRCALVSVYMVLMLIVVNLLAVITAAVAVTLVLTSRNRYYYKIFRRAHKRDGQNGLKAAAEILKTFDQGPCSRGRKRSLLGTTWGRKR